MFRLWLKESQTDPFGHGADIFTRNTLLFVLQDRRPMTKQWLLEGLDQLFLW